MEDKRFNDPMDLIRATNQASQQFITERLEWRKRLALARLEIRRLNMELMHSEGARTQDGGFYRAEISQARMDLRKYGAHHLNCPARNFLNCTCGLDDIVSKIEPKDSLDLTREQWEAQERNGERREAEHIYKQELDHEGNDDGVPE